MVNIAVLDDNDIQREILQDLLEDFRRDGHDIRFDSFASGETLIDSVRRNGFYDIYILDMILPDMTGLEVATMLRHLKDPGKIIFLTATLEYAVASYDVEAFYYLTKPVDNDKFMKILDRAFRLSNARSDMIHLSISKGEVTLPKHAIVYAELVDRVIRYHLSDGRVFDTRTIRTSFKQQTAELAEANNFAYLGVSYLVNLSHVDAIDSDTVLFRDGSMLNPPKSAYKDFKLAWKEFHLN